MLDPYVYPGTNILRNVLDIQERQMLDDAEADYVSLRLRELAENPLEGDYDVEHLTEMHKYIFQDIYEWAGKIRTINIEKEEPALVYCTVHISPNNLPEFPSAALASIDVATATPHSAALQTENSFCVIWLKMNGTAH